MTEGNGGDKALALFQEVMDIKVADLDTRQRDALGVKILPLLPPQANIKTPTNALLYVASCMSKGVMPFHGPYAWEQRGQLYIQEHYSVIIKWARAKDDFIDWSDDADPKEHGQNESDLVSVTHILSKKDLPSIGLLVAAEAFESAEEARARLSTSKPGVVTEEEMFDTVKWVSTSGGRNRPETLPRSEWKPKDAPHGWTWRMVAEKRSMLNAIRWKYGWPSPSELRDLQGDPLTVDDVQTEASDWSEVTPDMTQEEAETLVVTEATARETKKKWAGMTQEERDAKFKKSVEVLRGDPDFDLTAEPEQKEEPPIETDAVEVDEDLDDILDELSQILANMDDDDEITEGMHRFKIQKAYEKLKLGIPNWGKLTVVDVSTAIAEARPALDSKEEAAESEEEPVEQEEEKEASEE